VDQDSTVTLSASKAKELGVSAGDVVVLVGRRRHAAYGKVAIDKKAASSGGGGKHKSVNSAINMSQNMAANLRLRQDDKVKVEPLQTGKEEAGDRSGDLLLVQQQPVNVASVTLSPVEDSLNALVSSEGGDMIDDSEIQERFVAPYLEIKNEGNAAFLKQKHLLTLRDENGKRLEFYVTRVTLEGTEEDEDEDETEGTVEKTVGNFVDCSGSNCAHMSLFS